MLVDSQKIWQIIEQGVLVIVDAGKNFIQTKEERPVEEYLVNAKVLVDEAVAAGAHIIKWQTHNVEDEQLNLEIVSPHFNASDRYSWVKRNSDSTPVDKFWHPLREYCDERGIVFCTTPMSRGAAQKIDQTGRQVLWKVGSADILDFVLLDYIRQQGLPIIISSGMSTIDEVEKSINFIKQKNKQVALLHCVSKYPCPPEELHLGTIAYLKKKFNLPIGFSDHSIGVEQDLLAVAMGATIVEKHFSLSRDLWGADHKVSMIPDELKQLVEKIDVVQKNLDYKREVLNSDYAKDASGTKLSLLPDEEKFRPIFRKCLVAARDMTAGTKLTGGDIYGMRPMLLCPGLPTQEYDKVLGNTLVKAVKKYDPIKSDILKN